MLNQRCGKAWVTGVQPPKKSWNRERICAARDLWQDLNELIIEYLESVKLADLAQKQRQINDSEVENMFYI